MSEINGCVGMSLVNRDSVAVSATTTWPSTTPSERRAGGPSDAAQQAWRNATRCTVEVAVVHRDHAAPEGACARLAWLSGDPGRRIRAIDTCKMAASPAPAGDERFLQLQPVGPITMPARSSATYWRATSSKAARDATRRGSPSTAQREDRQRRGDRRSSHSTSTSGDGLDAEAPQPDILRIEDGDTAARSARAVAAASRHAC